MHSVTLDSSGSPRKRTLSRGISEDESLRSIIKEAESSARRVTRSDSRAGTLKRRTDSQHSDQDLSMGLPEMLELQASYDEAVQELRGLEIKREALLFQVDVLQDTLEGVEELLAEAQREAKQASLELEQERKTKRKLDSMVCSLMQEVERLKEERNNHPSAAVNTHGDIDDVTTHEPETESATCSEDQEAVLCQSPSVRASGQSEETEDEGGVLPKLRMKVSKPLSYEPSLALDNPVSVDGVLQRPYKNEVQEERDPSPDQNDSDSQSAYEDASAETPEQDRLFPGKAETLELPHDSEKEESSSTSCQVSDEKTHDPEAPEQCIVS